ncbi:hypothetical protein JZ751_018854 [Albula glossodonta]|uniref:Uncharacterized protein n=1 Tax=Albula glossodonta TaxID=121402 RepID=A0A8T2MV46_9TELE|nr:hypothetical protein JZ751_018854 [Albula glossodonta]
MARPQTDGGVDSGGQGGQRSCRMEALRPDGTRQEAWHRGGVHALQVGYQPCYPRRDIATQTSYSTATHGPDATPASLPSEPSVPSSGSAHTLVRQSTDTGRDLRTSVEGPLPDLLPQRQHPLGQPTGNSGQSAHQNLEDEVSGRNAGPQLQNWRGLCWGLFTLITDTLSTLYLRRHR